MRVLKAVAVVMMADAVVVVMAVAEAVVVMVAAVGHL